MDKLSGKIEFRCERTLLEECKKRKLPSEASHNDAARRILRHAINNTDFEILRAELYELKRDVGQLRDALANAVAVILDQVSRPQQERMTKEQIQAGVDRHIRKTGD